MEGGAFDFKKCPRGGVFKVPHGQIPTSSPPSPHLGYLGLNIDRHIISEVNSDLVSGHSSPAHYPALSKL